MPRQINVQGLRALIKHNTYKQLPNLHANHKKNITNFINGLTLEELKQKGLTAQIVAKYKMTTKRKPRKVLSGGMKRSRDDDDDEDDKPTKRSFFRKIVDTIKGNPYDDDKYNKNKHRKEMRTLVQEEIKAKQEYERAQQRTKEAREEEALALATLTLIRKKKDILQGKTTSVFGKEDIDEIKGKHQEFLDKLKTVEIDMRREKKPWGKWRDEILREMSANNLLYRQLTGEDLPEFIDSVRRNPEAGIIINESTSDEQANTSSSSSSRPQAQEVPPTETSAQNQEQPQRRETDIQRRRREIAARMAQSRDDSNN